MFSKSTWLHLRIPFSYFLLPIYLFAFAISDITNNYLSIIVFVALHIFLYPASNGYNSYFDKDEKSIGGLKKPPKVKKELYYAALLFDLLALLFGVFNFHFMVMLFIYGLVSKAYSHPSVRIKKYPFASWFIAGFFQGFFTFLMVYLGIHDLSWWDLGTADIMLPAMLTSLMLWGSYPMTQIYQHEEDTKRGDITLSVKLGVMGTFHFTLILFTLTSACFFIYFFNYFNLLTAIIYLVSMGPVVGYFFYWYLNSRKNIDQANFENTMRLNAISATFLNLFFMYLSI